MSENNGRRKLLKSIAIGSGAVVTGKSLPESWSKPVVNSVLLPAHAETTEELPPELSTYYSRSNLSSPEYDSNPGGSDHIRACVMLDGATASVTFQSIYRDPGSAVDQSDVLLTGTLTDGTGTLTKSPNSCAAKDSFSATITDVTPTSLTLNLVGNRTVSTVLPAANACVAFIPDTELCNA